ncbi:hypothetical protein ACFL1H_02260 [Nanoarchaeota archaeon]
MIRNKMKINIKSWKMLFVLLFMLFLIPFTFATLNIDLNVRSNFILDDTIKFNYSFLSDKSQTITYFVNVICPEMPVSPYEMKSIDLNENEFEIVEYNGGIITEDINSQKCKIIFNVLEPDQIILEEFFSISTQPSFSFNLKLCKDKSCSDRSKIFLLNDMIYLDYTSSILTPAITTTLIYPDGKIKKISFAHSIEAEQMGTYTIEITASKEGFKNIKLVEQFAVIEKEPEIRDASVCNGNGICDSGENSQNCPQDCVIIAIPDKYFEEVSIFEKLKQNWIIIIIIVAVILILIIYFIIRKRKHKLVEKVVAMKKNKENIEVSNHKDDDSSEGYL